MGEMEYYHVPGLAACIVYDDEIVWTFAHGYQRIEPEILASDTTLFMMASISKTFTGTAVLQLWEDGLLELSDPINDHLTEFQVVIPSFPDSVITVWNLLTHTSSLKDNWTVMWPLYTFGSDSPIPLGEYLFDYFDPTGLYYDPVNNFYSIPPGNEYHYCNEAYALLGYLVEEIADMPFDQYSNEYLFEPMGMYETSWFLADLDTNHIAMPYLWSSDHWEPYGQYGYPDYPCGQLRTSSLQLAQMLIAFLNDGWVNGYQMLDSSTVVEATTHQCPDLNPEMGLTWFNYQIGSHNIWGHGGGDLGVSTGYGFCPSENTGVVVLMNARSSNCLNSILGALADYAEGFTGINGEEPGITVSDELDVMPNPCSDIAEIELELQSDDYAEVAVYDLAGHRILTPFPTSYLSAGSHSISMDVSKIPTGVYIVLLRSGQRVISTRLVHLRY